MIIGLAFIGFFYGLIFGARYADVMGGNSTDWAFGSVVGWTFAGGIAGWVFQNITRAFSKRDILRSMCTALGFLYGVWLHRMMVLDYSNLTIGPIIWWSIVGNFVGYIAHGVFGKDTDEEITAPANVTQNHNAKGINSVLANYQLKNPFTHITQWIQPSSNEHVIVRYTNSKGENKATRVRPDSISLSFRNNVLLLKVVDIFTQSITLNFERIQNPEVLGFQTTPTVNPEAQDPEPLPPTLREQDSTTATNTAILEPEAFIVGNLTGTELLYTRNDGSRGVIYFDQDSIELTDSYVTLQATGTTTRFSILRERILNPDVLSAPLITEEEEELPPIIEPTRKIIGDPSGQKLIYTRNNGEEGLIFFEPNSLEITAERIIVSPYHTEEEYAIERVRIKNLQELINPTQTELPLLPPTLPDVAATELTPVTPIVNWKIGTRVIIEELPIDTYEATQIMRRIKPNLNPFEVLEAVKFKPERDQLLQGYNPAIAEDIKTDFEAAGCTVSLKVVKDHEVEADQVAPIASTQTETLEPATISVRPPTEEEFHEIRMGTDRHRVFSLIANGDVNLNAADEHGYPLLHGCQSAAVAQLLAEAGVDIHARDLQGNTALHHCDLPQVQEVLIESGIPVDAVNDRHQTALHIWAGCGQLSPVKALLHFEADPSRPGPNDRTALQIAKKAASIGKTAEHREIVALLRQHTPTTEAEPPQVIESTPEGRTPTSDEFFEIRVLSEFNFEEAKKIIESGQIDVNAKDEFDRPLVFGVRSPQMLGLLIDHGADIHVNGPNQSSILHGCDVAEVCEMFIQFGANPNARDELGNTPLHNQVELEVAKVLTTHGAEIDAKSNRGITPLINAVCWGKFELAKYLIEKGADIHHESNAHSDREKTPLLAAEKHIWDEDEGHHVENRKNCEKIADLLRSLGATR